MTKGDTPLRLGWTRNKSFWVPVADISQVPKSKKTRNATDLSSWTGCKVL